MAEELTPESFRNWLGSRPTAPTVVGFMPGESAGIPLEFDDEAAAAAAWQEYYRKNPKAIPGLGASPGEKAAHLAAHPFGVDMVSTVTGGESALDRLAANVKRMQDEIDAEAAAALRPWIIVAVIVAGLAFLLARSTKKAAA